MTYLLPFGIGVFQVLVAPQTTLSFNSLLRGITEFSKAIVVMVMVFIGLPTWLSGKKKSACDVGSRDEPRGLSHMPNAPDSPVRP